MHVTMFYCWESDAIGWSYLLVLRQMEVFFLLTRKNDDNKFDSAYVIILWQMFIYRTLHCNTFFNVFSKRLGIVTERQEIYLAILLKKILFNISIVCAMSISLSLGSFGGGFSFLALNSVGKMTTVLLKYKVREDKR
jgi:hypothetical protein